MWGFLLSQHVLRIQDHAGVAHNTCAWCHRINCRQAHGTINVYVGYSYKALDNPCNCHYDVSTVNHHGAVMQITDYAQEIQILLVSVAVLITCLALWHSWKDFRGS